MRKKEGDGADSRNEGEGCQPIDSEPDEQLREMAGVICGIGNVDAAIRTRRTGCADQKWDGRVCRGRDNHASWLQQTVTQSQAVGVLLACRWTPCAAAGCRYGKSEDPD